MSVSTVLTIGLGEFGSIPNIILLGYGLDGEAPTPPPSPPPAEEVQRFGGGPFWRRYQWGDDDEDEREEREEELSSVEPPPIAAIAAAAQVERAVDAIRHSPVPGPVVVDAGEAYARAMRWIAVEVGTERLERQWEREVRRRLREKERQDAEDEEIMMVALTIN